MSEMIERVARAICMAGGEPESEARNWAQWLPEARAAMAAMKYTDADESALIKASNAERVEAVSLSMAWDAMIEEALNPTPDPPPMMPARRGPHLAALFRSMGVEVIDVTPTQKSPPAGPAAPG